MKKMRFLASVASTFFPKAAYLALFVADIIPEV